MLTINRGQRTEVTLRVFLESDEFGREYFDSNDTIEECLAAVARLTASALEATQEDGIARQIGIAIAPSSDYE